MGKAQSWGGGDWGPGPVTQWALCQGLCFLSGGFEGQAWPGEVRLEDQAVPGWEKPEEMGFLRLSSFGPRSRTSVRHVEHLLYWVLEPSRQPCRGKCGSP